MKYLDGFTTRERNFEQKEYRGNEDLIADLLNARGWLPATSLGPNLPPDN
jgi:hypothetical protein